MKEISSAHYPRLFKRCIYIYIQHCANVLGRLLKYKYMPLQLFQNSFIGSQSLSFILVGSYLIWIARIHSYFDRVAVFMKFVSKAVL